MTLPPQGSPHYELRKRIAGCRERLRKTRTAQRETERVAPTTRDEADDASVTDEDDEARPRRKATRSRR